MTHLSITNLSESFGHFAALKNISLDIQQGEFICLLGGSGCGKTTLLRIIAGLEKSDTGTISLDQQDVNHIPCHLRNIGMVFQSLALFPHLNVYDNVAYGPRIQGQNASAYEARITELLHLVGLKGFEKRAITSLSGGQRQRVAISRALAIKPDLFLMDEPFSALDAGLRDLMQIEIKRIQQELGVTTIFVTHDQREAMAMADRIVVLNDGYIAQAGTPSEIYAQPNSRFMAEFISTNNIIDVVINNQYVHFADQCIGSPGNQLSHLSGQHTLAIRPEHITLTDTPVTTSTHLCISGTLLTTRRLGAIIESEIQIAGMTFRKSAFAGQTALFALGQKVYVSWPTEKSWVIGT